MLRYFTYGPRFAPQGKTVVQVEFETEWDYWNDLQRADRARYDAEKAQVAAQVLDRLDAHLPGIESAVEMTDVATPHTFERYTGNWQGSMEGWLITTETTGLMMRGMKKTLPGLDNFFMTGQWVEPGGGLPTVARSGRQVIKDVCKRDRRQFQATMP